MAAIEVQKELVDKIYEVIEVAKASGKIKKGTNETTKSIEKFIENTETDQGKNVQ